jgi:hypothetical protein
MEHVAGGIARRNPGACDPLHISETSNRDRTGIQAAADGSGGSDRPAAHDHRMAKLSGLPPAGSADTVWRREVKGPAGPVAKRLRVLATASERYPSLQKLNVFDRHDIAAKDRPALRAEFRNRMREGSTGAARVAPIRTFKGSLSTRNCLPANAPRSRLRCGGGHRILVKGHLTLRHGCAPGAPGMTCPRTSK